MDYHSFGPENGPLKFDETEMFRRHLGPDRRPKPALIDTTQAPEDTESSQPWKEVLGVLGCYFLGITAIFCGTVWELFF